VLGAIVAIPLAASIQILVKEWWAWRQESRVAALVDPNAPPPPPDDDDGGGGLIVPAT
jgi:hypothetical protein